MDVEVLFGIDLMCACLDVDVEVSLFDCMFVIQCWDVIKKFSIILKCRFTIGVCFTNFLVSFYNFLIYVSFNLQDAHDQKYLGCLQCSTVMSKISKMQMCACLDVVDVEVVHFAWMFVM